MTTKLSRLTVLLLASTAAFKVFGYETGGELALEGEFADNINQSPDDPVSDVATTASGRISVTHSGSTLELSGVARGSYTDYLDNTFDSQWFLNSDIRAAWSLAETFVWNAMNQTNQVRINPLDVDVPSNIENQNLFRTGPEWVANFGATTSLTLGGTYGINSFSETNSDNERLTGYVQLRRHLNPHLALSIHGQTQETSFDDNVVNQDFSRDNAFVRFEWSRAALTIEGDAGVTRVRPDGQEDRDDPLYSFLATYLQSGGGVVTLLLRDAVGDSTSDFDDGLFSGEGDSQSVVFSVSDLFRDRRGELVWDRKVGRITGRAGIYYRDREFFTSDFDQIQFGASVDLDTQVSPKWVFSFGAGWDRTEFSNDGREDDFGSISLGMTRKFGPRLGVFLRGAYLERDSTDPNFVFDDVRVVLGIRYQMGAQPLASNPRNRRTDALTRQ